MNFVGHLILDKDIGWDYCWTQAEVVSVVGLAESLDVIVREVAMRTCVARSNDDEATDFLAGPAKKRHGSQQGPSNAEDGADGCDLVSWLEEILDEAERKELLAPLV